MRRARVALLLGVLTALIAAACGGSDDSEGVSIEVSTPQAQRNVPVQQQAGQPVLPNQPNLNNPTQAIPSVQAPQVTTGSGGTACSLITRADAAAAMGQPVNEGRSIEAPKQNLGIMTVDISTCSYNVTNAPGQVGIETWKASDVAGVKTIATATCQGREKVNLGDTACWGNREHTSIQVFKGTSFINLNVRSGPNEAAVLALAKKVVDKL